MSPYTSVTKNLGKPAGAILGKKVDSGRSSLELDTAGMRNMVSLISMKNIRLIPTKTHGKLSCFKILNVFFLLHSWLKKKDSALTPSQRRSIKIQVSHPATVKLQTSPVSRNWRLFSFRYVGEFLLLPNILPFIAFLDTKLTVADTEDERSQK